MDVENWKFKKRKNNSKLLQKWIIVECIIDDLLSRICCYVNDKIKAELILGMIKLYYKKQFNINLITEKDFIALEKEILIT